MGRAPWDRPGETPATRRLRIFIFFGTVVGGVLGLVMLGYLAWMGLRYLP